MSVELHSADPKFKRLAPFLLGAIVVAGGTAVWLLDRWLGASSPQSTDGMLLVTTGLVVVLASISLGLAYALWQEAGRIRREDRFPPSDMRTVRDVAVRHGAAALRYARAMQAGAAAAALTGVGILIWGYRLLRMTV
jgi:hypothetical protein